MESQNKYKRSQTNKKVKDKESSCNSSSSEDSKFQVITTSSINQYQFPNLIVPQMLNPINQQESNYLIYIRKDFFYPSYLKVSIGSIIEWKVSED